jgi:site-specific DNA-methyltransferase (adenine-specific)
MGRPREYDNDAARQRAWRARRRAQARQVEIPDPSLQIGDLVTLYCGDGRVIGPMLRGVDAVITDPPYGRGFDFTRPRRSKNPLQPSRAAARWKRNVRGDTEPFDATPWLAYPQSILWGGQYFAGLPPMPGWLVWDKRDSDSTPDSFGDCEMAWTNLQGRHAVTRVFRLKWRGIVREGEANVANRRKFHPTEKAVELMVWTVAKTTGTVLDPFMGSGSTGEACIRLGRPFIGIELDPYWYEVACGRLALAAAVASRGETIDWVEVVLADDYAQGRGVAD